MHHTFSKIPLLVFSLLTLLSGCSADKAQSEEEDYSKYAFVFKGAGTTQTGRKLHFRIYGNEDKTLNFATMEVAALSFDGKWEFVSGKGYKFTFGDSFETFKYTRYQADKQRFIFDADFDFGNAYGDVSCKFSYVDKDFTYDGTGFESDPPIFNTNESNAPGVAGKIKLGESTFIYRGSPNTGGWDEPRSGTWQYDKDKNVYHLTFNDDCFKGVAPRDFDIGWTLWTDENITKYRDGNTLGLEYQTSIIHEVTGAYGKTMGITLDEMANTYNYFNNTYDAVWNEEKGYYWVDFPAIYSWGPTHETITSVYATFAPAE